MKILSKILFTAIAAIAPLAARATGGLEILRTSPNNTLVRITEPKRYLILPIEEEMPDARIDVLVNGNIAQTFYARLACSVVDFTVPFDLSPYTAR